MALHPEIVKFMKFLRANQGIRTMIAAPPDETLLYAGATTQNNPWSPTTPVYRMITTLRATSPALVRKKMLHEVLRTIPAPGTRFASLLAYVERVDEILAAAGVAKAEAILPWRALSGIFAANARGAVSFYIGDGVTRVDLKVFALTEVSVLARNPNVDQTTRDALGYYERCIRGGDGAIRLALIRDV